MKRRRAESTQGYQDTLFQRSHYIVATIAVMILAFQGCGEDDNQSPRATENEDATESSEPVFFEGLEFPEVVFESKFVEVEGSLMHYYEAGDPDGPAIVLSHGWPSWSYIWRDVIPHLEDSGRVIAFDLIGFGRSNKLEDNNYSFAVQQVHFAGFIDALGLENLILVLHDWGSGIGFDYAARNSSNIRGIVFFEAMMPPRLPFTSLEDAFPGDPQGAMAFQAWRTPGVGEDIFLNQAQATEVFLPGFVLRELSDDELNAYRAPWPTPESRWPLWWVPNELPVAGVPESTDALIRNYIDWLQTTDVPMLEFFATPGLTGQADVVEWTIQNIANLTTVDLGPGIHFLQEDYPEEIGSGIAEWIASVPIRKTRRLPKSDD
ncbi:MAG: haloalkane dehalogenase [Myxococcota bacterium]